MNIFRSSMRYRLTIIYQHLLDWSTSTFHRLVYRCRCARAVRDICNMCCIIIWRSCNYLGDAVRHTCRSHCIQDRIASGSLHARLLTISMSLEVSHLLENIPLTLFVGRYHVSYDQILSRLNLSIRFFGQASAPAAPLTKGMSPSVPSIHHLQDQIKSSSSSFAIPKAYLAYRCERHVWKS